MNGGETGVPGEQDRGREGTERGGEGTGWRTEREGSGLTNPTAAPSN